MNKLRTKQISCGALRIALLTSCIAAPQLAFAASTEGGIEEVTVTATRRSESLQTVPIAITALSAEAIDKAQITNPMELNNTTPGLVMNFFGGTVTPFIRGVGSNDGSPGQESAVAMYIDGVYQASTMTTQNDFNNVERVEVDKGPQGTLFGRNATGGAIQIITKDPSHTASAKGSFAVGNYDTIEGKFYGTTGVTDDLAGDVAITYHGQKKGYGINITLNKENDKYENAAFRSKWVYTPGEDTKITLTGDFGKWSNSIDSRQPVPGTFVELTGQSYTGNYYDSVGDIPTVVEGYTWGFVGRLDQSFAPFNVTNIVSYRHSNVKDEFDNDFTPEAIVDVDFSAIYRTFTEELQFQSKPESKLKWIAGGFFMSDQSGFGNPFGIELIGINLSGNQNGGFSFTNVIHTKSYAAFGEATYPIVDNLNLTAGVRYTKDDRTLIGNTRVLAGVPIGSVGVQPVPAVATIPNPPVSFSNSKPTWRGLLDYHFDPDVMAYGSVSRGFKSGNFNAVSGGQFGPETITAYEVGAKADLFDHKLRINPSAYYYNYDNIQISVSPGNTLITTNAGGAHLWGAELGGEVAPINNFTIGYGVGYMHNKFTKYPNAQCFTPQTTAPFGNTVALCNLAGTVVPKSPKFTFNLQPVYTIDTDHGIYTLAGSLFHTSSYLWGAGGDVYQHAYTILNARLGWSTSDERLGLAVWAKNLTNTRYEAYATSALTGDNFSAAPPRTYGIEATFNF